MGRGVRYVPRSRVLVARASAHAHSVTARASQGAYLPRGTGRRVAPPECAATAPRSADGTGAAAVQAQRAKRNNGGCQRRLGT